MTSASESESVRPTSLSVLTLNVWGLKYISKLRQFRINHIAQELLKGSWDIVALQELWCETEDWQRMVRTKLSQKYPYHKFFLSGAFGSGLVILSRYPIVDTFTQPYILNGLPIHVGHGDWFVGKGAGCASIDIGGGTIVDVWNTHTVAAGGEDGPEKARAHRICQAWQLSKMIQNSADKSRHVIALGDFNSTPPSLSISLLRHLAGLEDAFLATHPSLPPHATSLPHGHTNDVHRSVTDLGVTCDSPLNSWTRGKKLDPRALAGNGKRLDYIFYRGPSTTTADKLRATSCNVCFTDPIPGTDISYTDHFGLESVFSLDSGHNKQFSSPTDAIETLSRSRTALEQYFAHANQTQNQHLMIFSLCITIILSLLISTPFIPYTWVTVIIILITVIVSWGGTTMLYSGLIWAEWEKRALRTVIESMQLDSSRLQEGGRIVRGGEEVVTQTLI
ncbi:unnamed protein product [Sympodiomycopsis kandeliae]